MDLGSAFLQLVIAAALVSVLDLLWLSVIAKDLYDTRLSDVLERKADSRPAIAFYVVFIAGLVYFVIYPAIDHEDLGKTVVGGLVFGLVTYGLWDLVNVLSKRMPAKLAPIDIGWGMVLAAATGAGTYSIWQAFS